MSFQRFILHSAPPEPCHVCHSQKETIRPPSRRLTGTGLLKKTLRREYGPQIPPPPPAPPPPPEGVKSRVNVTTPEKMTRGQFLTITAISVLGSLGVSYEIDQALTIPPGQTALVTRMKRNQNGRVFVQNRERDWDEVKASSTKPGLLLIRDRDGHVYRLSIQNRAQVDMSDNYTIMDIFGDGEWENSMEELYANGNPYIMEIEDFHKFSG